MADPGWTDAALRTLAKDDYMVTLDHKDEMDFAEYVLAVRAALAACEELKK